MEGVGGKRDKGGNVMRRKREAEARGGRREGK